MQLHTGENRWIRHIREQTGRLDGLMRQLLSLSKMDEDHAAVSFEDIDLSELVAGCINDYAELASGKDVQAGIAPHVVVRGNREGLTQLVSILMDNAVKYSDENGRIAVKLSHMNRKAVLEVSNTCATLPDADPQALFDRFYRADAARTQKSGGYGIGLSIAEAIVAQHKGRIAAFYDDAHTIRFRVEV